MTSKLPFAFDCAEDSSDGVTNAVRPSPFDGLAAAPKGTSTASASVASSAVRRFPLPHKALEREPVPRLPLPQSALARTLRRKSPFRILSRSSRPAVDRRNVKSRFRRYVTLLGHKSENSPVRVIRSAWVASLAPCALHSRSHSPAQPATCHGSSAQAVERPFRGS